MIDYDTLLKRLGSEIRARRITLGHSLGTLSRLSGVSKATLSKLENGKENVTVVTLYKICDSLGMTTFSKIRHD
jgi:transcriptional regulator with XRE-family HTH domain